MQGVHPQGFSLPKGPLTADLYLDLAGISVVKEG